MTARTADRTVLVAGPAFGRGRGLAGSRSRGNYA
jgi:hypothetical protein